MSKGSVNFGYNPPASAQAIRGQYQRFDYFIIRFIADPARWLIFLQCLTFLRPTIRYGTMAYLFNEVNKGLRDPQIP